MLNKILPKSVELAINNQTILFESLEAFEFALSGRTSVASRKMLETVHLTVEQLNDEAITIKHVESYFAAIISDYIQDPDSIDRALHETEPLVFSQDHDWREIIAALNNHPQPLIEFKHLAIVKYLQYLAARQDLINFLYIEKTKLPMASTTDAHTIESEIYNEESDVNGNTLNMVHALHGHKRNKNLQRLPKGENVIVELAAGQQMDVVISKYKCKIVNDHQLHFIDNDGQRFRLYVGKNSIGRDAVCSIVLNTFLRDISRVHLIIINRPNNTIELTDLSSHGTFIPSEFLLPKAALAQ